MDLVHENSDDLLFKEEKSEIKTDVSDIKQSLVIKEVFPEWSPDRDQDDTESLHVKEEPGELWSSSDEEDGGGFPFTVCVKSDGDDEENPESFQLHNIRSEDNSEAKWIKTESDEDGCWVAGPGSSPDQNMEEKASDPFKTEVIADDDDWQEPVNYGPGIEESHSHWNEIIVPEPGVNNQASQTWSVQSEKGFSDVIVNDNYFHQDSQATVHTAEKTFVCDLCVKRFKHHCSLKAHMRRHTGEKPFHCDVCDKRFTLKDDLKRHLRRHTGEKPFGCDVCNKRFGDQGSLKIHKRIHTGEKPFHCDVCGKRFSEKKVLLRHTRIHTGERPYGCDQCGKRFRHQCHLKSHLRIHTGEKPFGCDSCGKRFKHKCHLESHMRVHTGEKPYGCKSCGRSFGHQSSLKTHMRVHTGEKPFSCVCCGKSFRHQGSLKAHMSIHTGE
ncbi:uncharacterized protein KZ484_016124 [Pholidichthys leucotaenia]